MSKIVFIKNNTEEIRNKLKEAGFTLCVCTKFKDAIWLCYHPNKHMTYDIHGEGYADEGDLDEKYSPLLRIQMRLETPGYYSEEREFFDTVEEFLKRYECPERDKKGFWFCGKEVSWNEIPLDVRKHDYPYYFDKEGRDCFPEEQK